MYQLAQLVDHVVVKLFLMNEAKFTIGRGTDTIFKSRMVA